MNYIIHFKIAYKDDKTGEIRDSHHLIIEGIDYKVDKSILDDILTGTGYPVIELGYKNTFNDKEKGVTNITYRSVHNLR